MGALLFLQIIGGLGYLCVSGLTYYQLGLKEFISNNRYSEKKEMKFAIVSKLDVLKCVSGALLWPATWLFTLISIAGNRANILLKQWNDLPLTAPKKLKNGNEI